MIVTTITGVIVGQDRESVGNVPFVFEQRILFVATSFTEKLQAVT